MTNKVKRVISVFPCMEKLTKVTLRGPSPDYHQITTMIYLEYVDYMGEASTTPQFAVSLADDRWGGHFSFIDPINHQTSEIGRCGCVGGLEGKRRNPCREFGIFKGTPEELENNSELTHSAELRAAYLNDLEIKEAERKETAKEKAKINNQKAKEKREAKKAQEHDQERRAATRKRFHFSESVEPPPPYPRRPGAPDRLENHSVCGKPLPRSIEELADFKKAHGYAPEGNRWYCECGLVKEDNERN